MKSPIIISFLVFICCSFAMFGRVVNYNYDECGNMVSRHLSVVPIQQRVSENSSVEEKIITGPIKVYPNPVEEFLNVEISDLELGSAIQIGIFSLSSNQLESIDLAEEAEEPRAFAITYNSFRLPISIVSADSTLQVRYGYSHQGNRIRTEVQTDNYTDITYHFLGCYDETDDGICRLWLGGNDYYDATMLYQRTSAENTETTDKAYYFLRNHLGSITHIIDTSLSDDEKLVQEMSYDA